MLVSNQKLLALAAALPLLASAAPLVKNSEAKPFYLKPNRDQSQLMMVVSDADKPIYGGAPVAIRSVDYAEDGRTVYDQWEFLGSDKTQLKLTGTEFCLDTTVPHPSSFTELEVWPCNEALPAQDWQYSPIWVTADGTEQAKLSVDEGQQCLDWKDGSTEIAQAWECVVGNQNQLWIKTQDKHFSSVSSVYLGGATRVYGGETVSTAQVVGATTTAGSNVISSVLGNVQGGTAGFNGATGVPATSTFIQGVPSTILAPQVSDIFSSRLGPQVTVTAVAGGTTTAPETGATSISAGRPSSSIGNNDNNGATSVAGPVISSSMAAPAVQTVVVGGTRARRADVVISSVLGEAVNGNGATSTPAAVIASSSLAAIKSSATGLATGNFGATTSLAPAVTSSSALHAVPAATSTSVPSSPAPSSLVLLIPSSGSFNGSLSSNTSEIQKWTCHRE